MQQLNREPVNSKNQIFKERNRTFKIIRSVILGKIEELKETAELTRGLWDVLVLKSAWISNNNMLIVLLGKDTYEASEEERKEEQEKINSLPLHHQMLLTAYHCCGDVELAGYNGFYAVYNAQPLKKLYAREEQQEEKPGEDTADAESVTEEGVLTPGNIPELHALSQHPRHAQA